MSCRVALIALAVAVAIPYGLDIPALRDSSAVRSAFDAAAPLVDSIEHYLVAKFEQNKLPDWFSRMGVRYGLRKTLARDLATAGGPPGSEKEQEHLRRFIADLKSRPIAQQTAEANEQHYEVDTRFYNLVLGKHRKYSSALYPDPANMPVEEALAGLDDAESAMLEVYAKRAQIKRGGEKLRVLDLGCGWGSVTLWFAANFPQIDVVGFSNSRTQRKYILAEAKRRGLTNVDVITGNIVEFEYSEEAMGGQFDRVISIEMFEHMKNYQKLFKKVSSFLKPKGLLFVHIFVAHNFPYHFVTDGSPADWMARFFFRGGTMPSDETLLHFQDDLRIQDKWRVDGRHYSLTLEAWLQQMDKKEDEVRPILADIYGKDNIDLWTARWRAFFFVCSELFKMDEGRQWYVSHYLFQKPE